MDISEAKKWEYWNHIMAESALHNGFPAGATSKRLRDAKKAIFSDTYLWADMGAHGIASSTPEDLKASDSVTYNHMIGNFWGITSRWWLPDGS